ncbi:hypothetical protein G7Z17_g1776 [Cylindrodendrum hubeiense]|uniref:Xylanolytic transcriptional activator regulatory domain-containing protein n=1 Tax=Cylindrodendrum hubeiense TaxID=595255 RepID=A0A9P5HIX6_9HYPO|nr:hypothetical protein G7Z17_g1776 [Cylindrodendrum hubeiense]
MDVDSSEENDTPASEPKKPAVGRLADRLDEAVDLLQRLSTSTTGLHAENPTSPAGLNTSHTASSTTAPAFGFDSSPSLNHSGGQSSSTEQPVFEGDSSLTAQTAFATDMLENAVRNSSGKNVNLELSDAMSALRAILDPQRTHIDAHIMPHSDASQSLTASPDSVQTPLLPPVNLAMTILRKAKEDPRMEPPWFTSLEILSIDNLMSYLIKVYFPGGYSDADFIIVNTGLSFMLAPHIAMEADPGARVELSRYKALCDANIHNTLSRLSIYMPVTFENILALTFATSHAMENATSWISWTLSSTAIQMCQTLGYHKLQSMKMDPPVLRTQKIRIFWVLYGINKAVSLRLGRPSIVQDYDISVPIPGFGESHPSLINRIFQRGMKVSQVQGKIYEQLYSHSALNQPDHVRLQRANALADELKAATTPITAQNTRPEDLKKTNSTQLEMSESSNEMMRLTTMTLILRAVPVSGDSTGTLHPQCIAIARDTLEKHHECMPIMMKTMTMDLYIKWTLIFTPFVPFTVLFCHVIETSDESDLERLRVFVASLQSSTPLSDSSRRLQNLFQTLFNIAKYYLKSEPTTALNTPSSENEFDAYLRSLGMLPPATWNHDDHHGAEDYGAGPTDHSTALDMPQHSA